MRRRRGMKVQGFRPILRIEGNFDPGFVLRSFLTLT